MDCLIVSKGHLVICGTCTCQPVATWNAFLTCRPRVVVVCCFAELARCSTDKGLLFAVIMEMIKLFEDPSEPVRVATLKQVGGYSVDH